MTSFEQNLGHIHTGHLLEKNGKIQYFTAISDIYFEVYGYTDEAKINMTYLQHLKVYPFIGKDN